MKEGGRDGRADDESLWSFEAWILNWGVCASWNTVLERKHYSSIMQENTTLWNSCIWDWEGFGKQLWSSLQGWKCQETIIGFKSSFTFESIWEEQQYWRGAGIYSVRGMQPTNR